MRNPNANSMDERMIDERMDVSIYVDSVWRCGDVLMHGVIEKHSNAYPEYYLYSSGKTCRSPHERLGDFAFVEDCARACYNKSVSFIVHVCVFLYHCDILHCRQP